MHIATISEKVIISHISEMWGRGGEGEEKYRINCSLVVGFIPGY